jgi:hypothetical protein
MFRLWPAEVMSPYSVIGRCRETRCAVFTSIRKMDSADCSQTVDKTTHSSLVEGKRPRTVFGRYMVPASVGIPAMPVRSFEGFLSPSRHMWVTIPRFQNLSNWSFINNLTIRYYLIHILTTSVSKFTFHMIYTLVFYLRRIFVSFIVRL